MRHPVAVTTLNAIGIDISKGKSTVAVIKPFGEIVKMPFDVLHTAKELNELFSSPARVSDGHEKWIDFVAHFWHAE